MKKTLIFLFFILLCRSGFSAEHRIIYANHTEGGGLSAEIRIYADGIIEYQIDDVTYRYVYVGQEAKFLTAKESAKSGQKVTSK